MTTHLAQVDPVLPPEIEREIFEIAALASLESIPLFVLVAQRVRTWMQPLLYRAVATAPAKRRPGSLSEGIMCRAYLKVLNPTSSAVFHDHVRQLYFCGDMNDGEHIERMLSLCSGVVNLALFNTPFAWTLPPVVADLPLQRLTADLETVFPGKVDFTHGLFSQITHLDIFLTILSEEWIAGLGELPRLTHLSLESGEEHAVLFPGILASCSHLEVLLIRWSLDYPEEDFSGFQDDPRAVLVCVSEYLRDWILGATGGEDYWIRAERFICQRKSGEIPSSNYVLDPPPPAISLSRDRKVPFGVGSADRAR
ncbi:hypothetical protein C8R43DRAFT_993381 [Mycena crocata]|nr:hypothetical protein C8R43DRAFT_993381 [Mycena crocata]